MKNLHIPTNYSVSEIVEFGLLVNDYMQANPKASAENLISATMALKELYDYTLNLRWNVPPKFNQ